MAEATGKKAVVVGAAFVVGGVVLMVWSVLLILKGHKASGWPRTDGKILSSEVVAKHGHTPRGTRAITEYSPRVAYVYGVEGRQYSGDKIRMGHEYSGRSSVAKEIAGRYVKDAQVEVMYNPDKPDEAVLETGVFGEFYLQPVLGIAFLAAGGIVAVRAIRHGQG
jgi:hypothetical protein